MTRSIPILFLTFAAAACRTGADCMQDSHCSPGLVCDVPTGVCVRAVSDAGTGTPPSVGDQTDAGAKPDPGEQPDAGTQCSVNQAIAPTVSFNESLSHPNADFGATVLKDGVYKMWWCGRLNKEEDPSGQLGNAVLYAEADSLSGPWHAPGNPQPNTYSVVFKGTGRTAGGSFSGRDFDSTSVCSPAVVRWANLFFMFYEGTSGSTTDTSSRVGLATSPDGLVWQRQSELPILTPQGCAANTAGNRFGAGHASAVVVDERMYLAYSDTTGCDTGASGEATYVLRSRDPFFKAEIEELSTDGFVPVGSATRTRFKINGSGASELQFSDALDAFVVASSNSSEELEIQLYDRNFKRRGVPQKLPAAPSGFMLDQPALVSRPDKHSLPDGDLSTVPLDVFRSHCSKSSRSDCTVSDYELRWVHAQIDTGLPTECISVAGMFEGSLVRLSDGRKALVRRQRLLTFDIERVAEHFSRNLYSPSSAMLSRIPRAGTVARGLKGITSTNLPGAWVVTNGSDDYLWPVSCLAAVTDNGSVLDFVPPAQYYSYPVASALFCVD